LDDLGIEPHEDDEFAWIAEVGLQSELPPGWSSRTDDEGAIYYVDNDTLATTWEHPLTQYLKQVVEIGRMYLAEPQEGLFQEQKTALWQDHKAHLDVWHGPLQDDEGNNYFVNSQSGISSWQDPRLARAYVYDLQCGVLNHLQSILAAEDHGCFPGGTPWETEDGAQILTLEPQASRTLSGQMSRTLSGMSPVSGQMSRTLSGMSPVRASRVYRDLHGHQDHSVTLRRMSTAAEWLQATVQREEDVQRTRLIQKVEERRMRKLHRKLSKTIRDTVQDDEDTEGSHPPRARSKARGKL
jgi:hypothetical protein